MDLSDIKKEKKSGNIILKRAKKRGPKSKLDPEKDYVKIHPDVSAETRRKINILMALNDQQMWEVIEESIELLAKNNKVN